MPEIVKGIFMLATSTGFFCTECKKIVDEIDKDAHTQLCEDLTHDTPTNDNGYGVDQDQLESYDCLVCDASSDSKETSRKQSAKVHYRKRHPHGTSFLVGNFRVVHGTRTIGLKFSQSVTLASWITLKDRIIQDIPTYL